jgi:hypothetical protein
MSMIDAIPLLVASGADGGYQISRSVRLRSSASAYLDRTMTSSFTSQRIFTFSFWLKRGTLSTVQKIFDRNQSTSLNQFTLGLSSDDTFGITARTSGTTTVSLQLLTSGVFRDPSAWYHFMIAVDNTQATLANRGQIYVNGVLQALGTQTVTQNVDYRLLTGLTYDIGRTALTASQYFDGYLAEFNFIDGQQLTPSSFGETNAVTGVWQPKKYAGTYGTNGFYLNFSDNSNNTAATIGKDYSGNGNNFTPSAGISVTAGATYDSMIDVPTPYDDGGNGRGNYPVLNPLWRLGSAGQATPSNGNLTASSLGNNILASTIPLPPTGKWYMEFTLTTGQYADYGIASSSGLGGGSSTGVYGAYYNGSNLFLANGAGSTSDGNQATTTGDIGLIAVDVDNNKMWIGRTRSGTTVWMGGGSPSAGTSPSFSASGGGGVYATTFNAQTFNNPFVASGAGADVWNVNFGQRPFTNTPPTGFVALNTQNLPTPTISNGASYMAATTYTGTGSALTVANTVGSASFQPDLVWVKGRSGATDHALYDAVRGVQKQLESNNTAAETTETTGLTAFGSTGFTVGALAQMNTSAATYVGWQWNAGGSTVTNTSGSISAQVRANPTAGFSVVTYTGTGANATVGHGLGVAPKMMILINRDTTHDNIVWHTAFTATERIYLNLTNAKDTGAATSFNSTLPSSSVISLGSNLYTNGSTNKMVAYCFAEVAGYSAFGKYTGNGSADGPFVFLGLRPRWFLVKRTDVAATWYIWNTSSTPYNVADTALFPNLTNAESSNVAYYCDILSNGFKIRATNTDVNANGGTYIYMAFAEVPFRSALAR